MSFGFRVFIVFAMFCRVATAQTMDRDSLTKDSLHNALNRVSLELAQKMLLQMTHPEFFNPATATDSVQLDGLKEAIETETNFSEQIKSIFLLLNKNPDFEFIAKNGLDLWRGPEGTLEFEKFDDTPGTGLIKFKDSKNGLIFETLGKIKNVYNDMDIDFFYGFEMDSVLTRANDSLLQVVKPLLLKRVEQTLTAFNKAVANAAILDNLVQENDRLVWQIRACCNADQPFLPGVQFCGITGLSIRDHDVFYLERDGWKVSELKRQNQELRLRLTK